MSYKIVTKQASTFHAEDVVDDVSEEYMGKYVYYMFIGNPNEYVAPVSGVDILYDNESEVRKSYNNMLFGKKITPDNINLVVTRHDYIVGEVYDAYDDTDTALFSKRFYVVVKNGSSYDVFKCLDNNNGSPSTSAPSRLDIAYSDEIYRTSDNYVWKYMYTITSTDMTKFSTDTFIPIMSNNQVSNSAVDGSIDVIKVDFAGSRYDNYLSGTIGASDLNVGGSKYKVNVSGNSQASIVDDFYIGCIFKIVSGTGVGSYSTITEYKTTGNNRVITLQNLLNLDLSSTYEISPGVSIIGDGYQTVNAFARAIVNSAAANSISYIEILDRGAGYKSANAVVEYNTTVPVDTRGAEAVIRPIMAPTGGHGFDANNELGSSRVCFSMTFNEAVDNFPSTNDFRQVGIMTNPRYANVYVYFDSKDGSFQPGETAYAMNPVRLYGTSVTVNTSSNTMTATTGDFANSVSAGDYVYLSGSGTKQLAQVHSVTNATSMVLKSQGAFSCTDTQLYLANIYGEAKVNTDDTSLVVLDQVYIPYEPNVEIIGVLSGAYGVVDHLELNDQTTVLNKFNQMWKYEISTSDTFEEDEVVYQQSYDLNHGLLHSVIGASNPKTMYVTNQFGIINTGGTIYGNTSHATATVLNKYQPDIIFNSGRIVYLENLEPVTRASGQKETFKIIFEY